MKQSFTYITTLLVFVCCSAASGQGKLTWKYAGLVQAGVAAGTSGGGFTGETIHGFAKNNWFAGLGAGFDNYGIPGVPVVLHGRKAFTQLISKPFVYSQAGIQIPVKTGVWADKGWDGTANYDLNTGLVGEAGVGYLFGLGRKQKTALLVTTGYSYKYNRVKYTYSTWPIWLSSVPPPGYEIYRTEKQEYHYRRLVLRFGLQF